MASPTFLDPPAKKEAPSFVDKPAAPSPSVIPQTLPKTQTVVPDNSSIAIKNMQQAIFNMAHAFANLFSTQSLLVDQYRESFIKYILAQSHKTSDPGAFNALLTRMQQIGSGANINRPDGIWGQKTNAALRDILAVLRQLTALQAQLKVPGDEFHNEVVALEHLIPADPQTLSSLQKEETANNIAQHLNAIMEKFLEQFHSSVIIPHGVYLSGERELIDLGSREQLTEKEQELFEKWKDYPVANIKDTTITLQDLKDVNVIKELAQNAGFNINDPQQMKGLLEYLRKQAPQAIREY